MTIKCECGKYKGRKYRGIICDKCGTLVGQPKCNRKCPYCHQNIKLSKELAFLFDLFGRIPLTKSQREIKRPFVTIWNVLTPREVGILKLYYGWDDGLEKTMLDVGLIVNLSRARVGQIIDKARRKLRKHHLRERWYQFNPNY